MNLRRLQSYSVDKNFYAKFYVEVKEKSKKVKTNTPASRHATTHAPTPEPMKLTSLFWSFYSLTEQEILEQNKFKVKNAYCMKFVEDIKKDKAFLKQNKLKFHDIESSLLYDKDISLSTLKCMALFRKLNLIYVWNNKYYIFESNDEDDFYFIERNREKYSSFQSLKKTDILETMVKGKLYMEDLRVQLKAPGSYKMDDIKGKAELLSIPLTDSDGKRKTKQKLYEEINSKID